MKLVWLVNTILPQIARARKESFDVVGGWTVQLADILSKREDIELTVFYPQHRSLETIYGKTDKFSYVGFYERPSPELSYNKDIEDNFRHALSQIDPDIVHVWGSEFVHTLCMVNAYEKPERTVISIQGMISECAKVYCEGVPEAIVNRYTFRDFLRRDSIADQQKKYEKRGIFEKEALRKVKHIIGRTEWDKEVSLGINPKASYHY